MLKKIWAVLGSVRIVVPLLIVIILVSLVGVLVPQGMPSIEFQDYWWRAILITHLGLNHLFSTWWFYTLFGLLSINVAACSTSHQLANVRRAKMPHFLNRAEDTRLLTCSTEFAVTNAPYKTAGLLSGFFKRCMYFSSTRKQGDTFQVAVCSLCIKEIGSLLFHASILFFFAGGIVEGLAGFSFVKDFHKGEVSAIRDWNYLIRCDWFKIDKNDEGAVLDYQSKLSVLSSDSTPLFSRIIEVNHPLSFKGLSFYQYSYGEESDASEEAVLSSNGPGPDSVSNYTPRYFTGIKISRNPGALCIWLGFALMTLGIMLVFYFPYKSYWIFIEPGAEGASRIIVGASSGRTLSAFQKEFKRTCAFLQSLLKEGA
jgi:ResB protein required for cytochrome c biosynthesis